MYKNEELTTTVRKLRFESNIPITGRIMTPQRGGAIATNTVAHDKEIQDIISRFEPEFISLLTTVFELDPHTVIMHNILVGLDYLGITEWRHFVDAPTSIIPEARKWDDDGIRDNRLPMVSIEMMYHFKRHIMASIYSGAQQPERMDSYLMYRTPIHIRQGRARITSSRATYSPQATPSVVTGTLQATPSVTPAPAIRRSKLFPAAMIPASLNSPPSRWHTTHGAHHPSTLTFPHVHTSRPPAYLPIRGGSPAHARGTRPTSLLPPTRDDGTTDTDNPPEPGFEPYTFTPQLNGARSNTHDINRILTDK